MVCSTFLCFPLNSEHFRSETSLLMMMTILHHNFKVTANFDEWDDFAHLCSCIGKGLQITRLFLSVFFVPVLLSANFQWHTCAAFFILFSNLAIFPRVICLQTLEAQGTSSHLLETSKTVFYR